MTDARLTLMQDDANDGATESDELLTAKEVGEYLRVPAKKVYELPIPKIELSARRTRWLRIDVLAYVRRKRVA